MEAAKYKLCLYVAGNTEKSKRAIRNLEQYCKEELKDLYTVEVIDLVKHPHLAEGEQIIAVPTLIKKLPVPVRMLVGDLSDKIKVLVGLNIVPEENIG